MKGYREAKIPVMDFICPGKLGNTVRENEIGSLFGFGAGLRF